MEDLYTNESKHMWISGNIVNIFHCTNLDQGQNDLILLEYYDFFQSPTLMRADI